MVGLKQGRVKEGEGLGACQQFGHRWKADKKAYQIGKGVIMVKGTENINLGQLLTFHEYTDIGKKVPPEVLSSAKVVNFLLSVDEDANLIITLFGKKVNEQTKLSLVGLYTPEEYPHGIQTFKFGPNDLVHTSLINVQPAYFDESEGLGAYYRWVEHNVEGFLSLPVDEIELIINYINKKGVYVKTEIKKIPDFFLALQSLWSDPSLRWDECDNKHAEFMKLRNAGLVDLTVGFKTFKVDN